MTDETNWIPEVLRDAPYFRGEGRTPEQVLADLTNAAKLQGNMAETHVKLPVDESDQEAFLERVSEYLPEREQVPDPEVQQAQQREEIEQFQQEQHEILKEHWGFEREDKLRAVESILANAPAGVQESFANNLMPADQMMWLASLAEQFAEPAQIRTQRGAAVDSMSPQERYRQISGQLDGLRQGSDQYNAVLAKMNAALTGQS